MYRYDYRYVGRTTMGFVGDVWESHPRDSGYVLPGDYLTVSE